MTHAVETSPCPSCGRSTRVDLHRCLFCGTVREGRRSARSLKLCALPLLGMAGVYFFLALRVQPTYTPIPDLDAHGNFKRFRVKAEVLSVRANPDRYRHRIPLSIEIATPGALEDADRPRSRDSIRLKADGRIGAELLRTESTPSPGDLIDVSASLFAGAGYRLLSLNSTAALRVIGSTSRRIQYRDAELGKVLDDPKPYLDEYLRVDGLRVVGRRGRYQIEVAPLAGDWGAGEGAGEGAGAGKSTGESEDRKRPPVMLFGVDPESFRVGDRIRVRGKFMRYAKTGALEIKTDFGDPLAYLILETGEGPVLRYERRAPRKVAETTVADLLGEPEVHADQRVRIPRAVITRCRSTYVAYIADPESGGEPDAGGDSDAAKPDDAKPDDGKRHGGWELELMVFGIDPGKIEPGDVVSVQGRFVRYEKRNTWEIKVSHRGSDRMRVIEPAVEGRETVTLDQLREDPDAYAGRDILVEKAIVSQVDEQYSVRVTDTLSKPAIKIFGIYPKAYTEGQPVTVRGTWVEYEKGGYWEIKARDGDGAAVRPLGRNGRGG